MQHPGWRFAGRRIFALGRAPARQACDFRVDKFAQTQGESVGEVVKDVAAPGFREEDGAGDEFAEVFGNVGLGGADVFDDFAHAAGLFAEGLQDGETQGVAEGPEESGDALELGGGERLFFRG